MVSHCIATLALAEVSGMETDDLQKRKVKAVLDRCLKVILLAQQSRKNKPIHIGGWRYEPASADSDITVTTAAAAALRACRDAGMDVPQEAFDHAIAFVLNCYRADQKGFTYQGEGATSINWTAEGIVGLHLLGASEKVPDPAVRWLSDLPVKDGSRLFYQSLFYATRAGLMSTGPSDRTVWPAVWKNASDQLLPLQLKDGAWPARRDEIGADDRPGRFYPTAMALLTLTTPMRMLPLYQR